MSPALRLSLALAATVLASPTAAALAVPGPLSYGYVTDAPITTIVTDSQGRAYVGGFFQRVGPRLGHGIVLTTSSSTPAPDVPDINGEVLTAIGDGAGGWFIGGTFTAVGGVTRNGLAHIKADRTLDMAWNPGPNNVVRALALSGGALYVGGEFSQVGGVSHFRVAKVDAGTGAVDPVWLPSVGGSVYSLAVDGGFVYIGAVSVGGADTGLGRVSATGAGDFDPHWIMSIGVSSPKVTALAITGTTLYAGGAFTTAFGQPHGGLLKASTTTVDADPVDHSWNPSPYVAGPDGVRALVVSGSSVIIGGQFTGGVAKLAQSTPGTVDSSWHPDVDSNSVYALALSGDDLIVGGSYSTIGGQSHASLAKVSVSGGTPDTTWNPNPGAIVDALAFSGSALFAGGQFVSAGPQNVSRMGLARFNSEGKLDSSWNPSLDGYVNALVLAGTDLFVAGSFQHVGATTRPYLAKLDADTGALNTGWTPQFDTGPVSALALSGTDLFIAGTFGQVIDGIGAPTRNGLAKLSTANPVTVDTTWNPQQAGFPAVNAMVASGGFLYLGGSFSAFKGGAVLRDRIARIPVTGDGTPDAWNPGSSGTVNALAVSGTDVFAGGSFGTIGGQSRGRLAKLSTASDSADATWIPTANSTVGGLALDGANLYVAGTFSKINNLDRRGLARLSTTGTGALDSGFVPAVASGGSPIVVAPAGSARVFVGGSFGALGNLSLGGLGVFDMTPPSVSVSTPAEGGRYPQGRSVNAAYSCSDPDPDANLASCAGPVANGAAFDTGTAGPNTFTVTATDAGGDTGTRTVNYIVDASAPTITVTSPAEGASFTNGQVVTAAFSCGDADGAGDVASCTGSVASGAAIDTSTDGTHTVSVTSTDVAGNSTTDAVSYTVSTPVPPDTTAPAITGWRINPATFRAASGGGSAGKGRATAARKKTPIGARVSYALSEAAPKVVVTVLQLRKHKKPLSLGRFTITGKAGANRFKFTGRLNGGKLAPGSYRLSAKATDAAKNTSKAALADFKIVKR